MTKILVIREKKVSFFNDIKGKSNTSKGKIDIDFLFKIISSGIGLLDDKEKLKKLTHAIRFLYQEMIKLESDEGKSVIKEKIDKLKMGLPCIYNVNPEGKSSKSNTTNFNGLMIIDFDEGITTHTFGKLENDPYILGMFESPSKGIKAIIELDIPQGEMDYNKCIDFYENFAFKSMANYFTKTYNLEIDDKCKNINRACYIPVGSKIYQNEDYSLVELWSQYEKENKNKSVKEKIPKSKIKPSATSSLLFTKALEHLKNSGIGAFDDYNEWLNLGFILLGYIPSESTANQLFHKFSELSPKYNHSNTEVKWKSIVKTGYDPNKITIKWFFRLMESKWGFNDKENVYTSFKYTPSDITSIFSNQMGCHLILEEISKQYYIRKNDVESKLDDIELNSLLKEFRDNYLSLEKKTLQEYLFTKDLIKNENFLLKKLESFKTNDRSEFDKVFLYLHTKDNDMTKKIFYRWMLGVMKNLLGSYGQYYDEILILKGDQMIGKSWFINNALTKEFKEWTTTTFDYKDKNKDNLKLVASYMFCIDDELSMARKSDIEAVKRATSLPHVQLRLPYSSTWDNFKRISSFIGLTNQDDIFRDDSGGRRFLVCDVCKIDKEIYDLNWCKIWGFIYNEWLNGKEPILDSLITRENLLSHADNYRTKDDIEEYLLDNFEITPNPHLTKNDVMKYISLDYQMLNRRLYLGDRQISNKIKQLFNITAEVSTINGKSVRKYRLKYKGNISNMRFMQDNKIVYTSNRDDVFDDRTFNKKIN